MRQSKMDTRPKLTKKGVAAVLGINKGTLWRRVQAGTFSFDGIPFTVWVRKPYHVKLYDMEAVFKRVYPGASRDGLARLMYTFREQHNGELIR